MYALLIAGIFLLGVSADWRYLYFDYVFAFYAVPIVILDRLPLDGTTRSGEAGLPPVRDRDARMHYGETTSGRAVFIACKVNGCGRAY